MQRIVFLVHRHGTLDRLPYYARAVADVLRAEGVEVVVAHGPEQAVAADLAFQHVDLTVVPEDHNKCLERYPLVINGKVRDISKRCLSRLTLKPDANYDGQVIIKANRNCGGIAEAYLAQKGLLPASFNRVIREYPVLASLRDVPPEVWQDPDLVVERFIPEVRDGNYVLRMWKFLGDAETNTLALSKSPVVKGRNVFHREEIGPPPAELRQLRDALGFDFGKFDYAIANGAVVLYDANSTPTISRPKPEEMPRVLDFVAALKRKWPRQG